MPTAHPLEWPFGWPRHDGQRQRAKFGKEVTGPHYMSRKQLSMADARERLDVQLERMGAGSVVLSTNVELRLDGQPRANQRTPSDPGAALYFRMNDQPLCMACDKWDRVEDNIAAIAAHIDALRAQERWGVGSMERAFAGYKALPAPRQRTWWEVLGVSEFASRAEAERAYKKLAALHHPDQGGSHDRMAEINRAITDARSGFYGG